MFLSDNIRYLRKKSHLSQEDISKKLGYKSFTTIQKWETGIAEPPLAKLTQLAELFQVDIDELTNTPLSEGVQQKPQVGGFRIPILGKVAAGIPFEAIENIVDYEEIPANWVDPEEYFGLQIKGDSMAPRIQENDIVIIRKQEDIDSGDIAIVMVNGSDATCKKVKKTGGGILAIPLNPKYEPIFYSEEEIISLPVTIVGKVVELRGKL